RNISQRAKLYSHRVMGEGDALADEVTTTQNALSRALKLATQLPRGAADREETIRALESAQAVIRGNGPGGDLRRYVRAKRPSILTWVLGSAVDVVALRKDQTQRIRSEYHAFRSRSAWFMFLCAGALRAGLCHAAARSAIGDKVTLAPMFLVGVQLYMCWVLYFYVASALRESVLRMNGSAIRPWWIHHHYWAIATGMLLLSLPVDSPTFLRAIPVFLWWACLQGVVILVQNKFQSKRMYTRIALGSQSAMDVVAGEMSGGEDLLAVLYPLLFGLQGVQAWAGLLMIRQTFWAVLTLEGLLDWETKGSDLWGSRGFFFVGCLMLFMAVNNFLHTIDTIRNKRKRRIELRARSRSA
ncbi:TMPIT-like protein, partial [Helicosporidium sp. ATCC 50920]